MATVEQALERGAELLGYPTFDSLSKHQRLSFLSMQVARLAGLSRRSRFALQVARFPLPVDASQNEWSLPTGVDGDSTLPPFAGLFYVTRDPAYFTNSFETPQQEIRIIPSTDADLAGVDFNAQVSGGGGNVEAIACIGIGASRRLITFPSGATDNLIVWYHIKTNDAPRLVDDVQALDQFHMTLVPLAWACQAVPYCTWKDKGPEEAAAMRAGLLDPSNPQSLPNQLAQELEIYSDAVARPSSAQPSSMLQGFGSGRRRRRGPGRLA